jgi:TRAP-type mannitol/chloroaromatic compound transport system permease large subunit
MKDYDVEDDMMTSIVKALIPFVVIILLVLGVIWLITNVLMPGSVPAS